MSDRKYILPLIGFAIAGIMVMGIVIRDSNHMAWTDRATSEISSLATLIECCRDERGSYPESLEDLARMSNDSVRIRIEDILNHKKIRYEYRSLSDAFVITAIGSAGLLNRAEKLEKKFEHGEAHGKFMLRN